MKVHAIEESALALLMEMGKTSLPNEFMGILLAEHGVINQVDLIHGAAGMGEATDFSTALIMDMYPFNSKRVGTAHSHPNPDITCIPPDVILTPSDTDYDTFAETGFVHIIVTDPFDEQSWRAFNRNGEPISLEIVKDETNSGNGYF